MADTSILVVAVAAIGALAAGLTATRRPLVALGILAVLASLSRVTVETPVGTMRLEHPAIAVVAVVLFASGEFRQLARLPRWTYFLAACLAVYIGVLGVSSLVMAPDPVTSLRFVVWWAISICGGVVALLLARRDPSETLTPLALAAAATGATGIAVAVIFLVGGPTATTGIQDAGDLQPRVYALSWETNIYASYLAASVPFGLELVRRRSRSGVAFLLPMLVGFPLGVTRGAYLGLAAGVVCYLVVWWWRSRTTQGLARVGAIAAAAFVIGLVGVEVLLPNTAERQGTAVNPPGSVQPSQESVGPSLASPPTASATTASSAPSFAPYPDTIGFRLERVPVALRELSNSPLIGLGAQSFEQRHRLPSGIPDHIAILVVAVPYESGILGTVALTGVFVLLIVALGRKSRHPPSIGLAAAYLGAIASLLVSYQATNALHFAHNWLIIGAAVAVAAAPLTQPSTPSHRPSP